MYFSAARKISFLFVFLFAIPAFAQRIGRKITVGDVQVNGIMSGDGFGWKQNPSASLKFGKRISVFGGPVFYGKEKKPSSLLFGGRYCLMREKESFCGKVGMRAVVSAEHFVGVGLSQKFVEFEMMGNQNPLDMKSKLAQLQFIGWEYSVGVDFVYGLPFGFIFHSEASAAYYTSSQTNSSSCFTLRDNEGFSLRLGAGVGYEFGNEQRAKFPN
jgi:hypothetical protein